MATTSEVRPAQPDVYRFLRQALFRLRWITIAALLLITLAQTDTTGVGLPGWALVALFAAYNLLVTLIQMRVGRLSFAWVALLDVPVAGLLYALAAEAGGPLFVLFVLAVDMAAASLTLRHTLFYTSGVVLLAAVIDSALPLWLGTPMDVRRLGARLVMLALAGAGMAIIARRLILEHEAARSIRDEAAQLEALERLRAQFVSNVSHELRTPLTAARSGVGMVQTSASDRLHPEEVELLGNARRNMERLGLSIDDLLAHNQLASGTLRLDPDFLDLRTVLTRGIAAVHSLVQEKGQTLEVDLPEPLPVEGDAGRLGHMVVNLLANAHQHTPTGSHIMVSGRVTDAEVLLAVRDTGPGIPAAERERIFQRFHRLTSTAGGSGLGLAIAKAIVELHEGRIWVESGAGGGATFWVAVPRSKRAGAL